jgi:hypothetical protein
MILTGMIGPSTRRVAMCGFPVVLAFDTTFLLPALYLVGALLVGAVTIALVNRWRRQASGPERSDPSQQLAHFRTLYEQGSISQEEFERLRAVLGGQLRRELQVPPPPQDVSGLPEVKTGENPPAPNSSIQEAPRQEPPETGIRPT